MALDDYDDQIIGPAVWLAIASVLGWDADNPPPPPPPTLRRYHRRWAKFYSHAWDLASFIVTAIMVYTERRMYLAKDFRVTFMTYTLTTARAFQCLFMLSSLIEQSFYPIQHLILLGFLTTWGCIANLVIWRNEDPELRPVRGLLVVYFASHHLFCLVDMSCRHILVPYRGEITVASWLEWSLWRDSFKSADSTLTFTEMKISKFWPEWRGRFWQRQGVIILPEDGDHPEAASTPWISPTKMHDDVLHWSYLMRHPRTQKALWITVDHHDIDVCAWDVFQLLLATDNTISVDVSETRSILRPLLHALGTAWPEFKRQLAAYTVNGVYSLERCFRIKDPFETLLSRPLENIWNDNQNYGGDHESQQQGEMLFLRVVIHGIHNADQAKELYSILKCLPAQRSTSLAIVAISTPELFHHVSKHERDIVKLIYTLSLSKTGTVIYSGNPPALPWFNQNLFCLVLEGIFKSADEVSERLWVALYDQAASSTSERPEISDDLTQSTLAVFQLLHKIAEDGKKMLKFLSYLPVISRQQLNLGMSKDNIEIALILQSLVQDKSYKDIIPAVPEEVALSVINLTHRILDHGLPKNDKIKDERLLKRRAHRLLNILTDFGKILPEELAVHGVMRLSDHPVKCGGFSDIYYGQYTNSDGEVIEVALKVLKIFHDYTDQGRRLLQKFAKEALVWHYLKHPNIVPLVGVDGTTFPSPTMAMVSSWMTRGSVLTFMAENSPVSPYATALLNDIIQGLMYLHSENIVHGDLCGRNILINERGACLTDFGLAAFVESDTSVKTSTRSGSTRWMAPELLLPSVYKPELPFRRTPASDVWAFGCVCCEIWTEGDVPFSYLSDGGLIVALSDLDTARGTVPYKAKPCDKAGTPMPEGLWELVQRCFKLDAAERPAVHVIADILSGMKLTAFTEIASVDMLTRFTPGRSRTAIQILSPEKGASILPSEVNSLCTPSPLAGVVGGKGKERVRFEEGHTTVQFGPLQLDGMSDAEELVNGMLDGLLNVIQRDVLTRPLKVEKQDSQTQYVDLCFRSPVEANNFAMTWMVSRYDPYKEVSAVLLDN